MLREWKYHALHLTSPITENTLKQLGVKGWELAGCTTQACTERQTMIRGTRSVTITKYIYYFKMPKEAPTYGGPR